MPSYKYLGIWLAIAESARKALTSIPRMDYGAGVWGLKTFAKLQIIQNKAIRHVMGVGKKLSS